MDGRFGAVWNTRCIDQPIVQDHQIRSVARDGAGLSVNGAFGFLSAAFCNRGVLLVQFVDKLHEVSVDAGH